MQGGHVPGEIEGDPDIAGVGVSSDTSITNSRKLMCEQIVSAFLTVTALAPVLSLVIVIHSMVEHRIFPFCQCSASCMIQKRGLVETERKRIKPGFSEVLQAMVLSCSDAQMFTGAAYALALRYYVGCSVMAYHYNIVATQMLLTCATHLMAITVVRNYWEYDWLAVLRVVCKTGFFLFTGLLLSNQNSKLSLPFPSIVPEDDDKRTPFFMAAACFQSYDWQFVKAIEVSWARETRAEAFGRSNPGNHIEGWNKFLVILL